MEWFSAKLSFAQTIGSAKKTSYCNSIHLFKADGFEDALQAALQIGRDQEEKYWNVDGEITSKQLVEVQTLDVVSGDLEGAAIYRECAGQLAAAAGADQHFHPEDSQPRRTL